VIRAAIGMAVGLTVMAMLMLVAPTAADQRSGGASAQRGIGAQREIGGQRGAARGGARRGGRAGSATASRIERRSYYFAETDQNIEYAIFVSTKVDPKKKSPLVIGLHGLGTPPALWLSRISDAAQNAGYIVAAPMGYTVHGWYGANGPTSGRGAVPDLGELSERDVMNVLDIMRDEFNVDERRIYLAGHSMGGAGALYLGIKHKDIWAAVAASAPAVRTQFHNPADLEQARELPVILIQGDADRAVPVEQTRKWAEKMKALGLTHEYREIRGGTHASTLDQGARDIFRFFDKHVRPEHEPAAQESHREMMLVLPAELPVSFSDVQVTQGTDPHAYGIQLDLYKHDGAWVGFISEYTGSVADPPVGKLDDLQVDENTGRIAFTAKLSLGLTLSKGTRDYVPTRNLYEFTGRIDQDAVSGVLVRKLADDSAGTSASDDIVLKRKARDSNASDVSYDQWIRTWNEILKARGPKW
jgi:poly(3-hydroxybutyrate) depolymerase